MLRRLSVCDLSWFDRYGGGSDVQVLQVAAGELLVGDDLDLALTLLGDLDAVAEVAGAALNLDAVVEELLEGLDVEDLVVDGLRAVDDELLGDLLGALLGGSLLSWYLAYCSVLGGSEEFCSAQRTAKRCTYGCNHFDFRGGGGNAQRSGYPTRACREGGTRPGDGLLP